MNPAPSIYIVDDDDSHAAMIEAGLRDAGVIHAIRRCVNGRDFAERIGLGRTGEPQQPVDPASTPQGPPPRLIVLDLVMPELGGMGVLEALRGDERYAAVPSVVMTSLVDDLVVATCYRMGANLVIEKPDDPERFKAFVAALGMMVQIFRY